MDHNRAQETKAVERYLLGELSTEEAEEFELHFFGCVDCAEDLRITTLFTENAKAVFAEGYAPRKWWHSLTEVWRRPAFAAPAFAALCLVLLAGYQNGVQIPALRARAERAELPQVASIAVLHGVARGGEDESPAIQVPSGVSSLILKFDVSANPRPATVRCDIENAAGSIVESSTVPVPADGTVLLAVGTKVIGPGSWRLVTRDSASGAELARYPFKY